MATQTETETENETSLSLSTDFLYGPSLIFTVLLFILIMYIP